MALVQKKNRKKSIIYGVLVFVIIVGGGYLIYNNFIAGKGGGTEGTGGQAISKDLPTYSNFGEDLFQNGVYQNLKDFSGEKLPIYPANVPKGRDNPFLPKL